MMTSKVGRLSALPLALALTLGMMVHAVGLTNTIVQTAPATVSDVSVPGGCNGCGSIDHGMSAACVALCNGMMVVPIFVAAVKTGVSILPASVSSLAGRRDAPDPYPPRSIILS